MATTSNIYELTPFQYDQMLSAANTDSPLMVVVGPLDTDSDESKDKLSKRATDFRDLETLGLVEDFMNRVDPEIVKRATRPLNVYIITDYGRKMFRGTNKRIPN